MRHFLKTVLEKDQRVLLKLKSKQTIPSAEEDNGGEYKKKLQKNKLLERYVECLQKKEVTAQDARLFKVIG
jgi:hypothetical protein